MEKKIAFSGAQPSGTLTLGNYLGAVKNWVDLQKEYDCYYCVVNMHAMTVRQVPAELRKNTLDLAATILAAGVDPVRNTLYVQSHVPEHAELAWILNCFTYIGELSRMTQFKEKSASHSDNINAGLFTYPVLMAADILLYRTDVVPVGVDQKQHLEITRDIAQRFNNIYGDVFTVPEAYIPPAGAKIMSLAEPEKKMSKSDPNPNAYIALTDGADVIRRKIRRAVTDSEADIRLSEEKPGIGNLLSIYAAVEGIALKEAEAKFAGMNYGALKEGVAEAVVGALAPMQQRFREIRGDKAYIEGVLKEGADKAQAAARHMLRNVSRKIGYIPRP